MKKLVCTQCGFVGYPRKKTRGSIWLELVLWFFFLVPGFIYSIWRLTSRHQACPSCGNANMIPVDSPMGQRLIKDASKDDVYAVQRSEVLDEETCSFCLSVDGLTLDPNDKFARIEQFHEGCRGIWVQIMKDEVDPPKITGVPEEIAQCWHGHPNSLVQPTQPIVKPNSPAAKEVQRRAK